MQMWFADIPVEKALTARPVYIPFVFHPACTAHALLSTPKADSIIWSYLAASTHTAQTVNMPDELLTAC